MTAEQLATDVLIRIKTIDGFADWLVENPEEALRDAELLDCFAAIESPDAETVGVVQARIKLTQGWHCVSNTRSFECHG